MKITITDKDIIPIGTETNPYAEVRIDRSITITYSGDIDKVAEDITAMLIKRTYHKEKKNI